MSSRRYLKIVVAGAGGVGKSTIVSRLLTNEFVEHDMTVGLNIESWSIFEEDDNAVIKAVIFDLGGQGQFRTFQEGMIVGSHAALLVFDMSSYDSFLELGEWVTLLEPIPRSNWILVGNKIDEPDIMTDDECLKFASDLGIPFIKLSAKTGNNFESLLTSLEQILDVTLDGGGNAVVAT